MATQFSTGFAESPETLVPGNFDYSAKEALYDLENQGLTVVSGIQEEDLPAMAAIASEEVIAEYYPTDVANLYNSKLAAQWLARHGGHAVFRLLNATHSPGQETVAGYGWIAPVNRQHYPEDMLPDCQATLAVRMSARYQNQGLGRRFATAIVAGGMVLGAKCIGLAVWASNIPAFRMAKGIEAEWVNGHEGWRATRNVVIRGGTRPPEYDREVYRQDTQHFYQLPYTM